MTQTATAEAAGILDGARSAVAQSVRPLAAVFRNPALRVVTERWMHESRSVLERHVDASTARAVDALIEGLVLQRILTPELFPDEVFYEAFAALARERR